LAHFQNYVSASCSCSLKLSSFWHKIIQDIYIFSKSTILYGGWSCQTEFWKGPPKDHPS
jgi:hypothetical protein